MGIWVESLSVNPPEGTAWLQLLIGSVIWHSEFCKGDPLKAERDQLMAFGCVCMVLVDSIAVLILSVLMMAEAVMEVTDLSSWSEGHAVWSSGS